MIEPIITANEVTDLPGFVQLQGEYNATTNVPDLTTPMTGILAGDAWVVTVGGTFLGEPLLPGDYLIAKVDDPSDLGDWIRVERNVDQDVSTSGSPSFVGLSTTGGAASTSTITGDFVAAGGIGVGGDIWANASGAKVVSETLTATDSLALYLDPTNGREGWKFTLDASQNMTLNRVETDGTVTALIAYDEDAVSGDMQHIQHTASGVVFNYGSGDIDFTIKKKTSGNAFVYDADAGTFTIDGASIGLTGPTTINETTGAALTLNVDGNDAIVVNSSLHTPNFRIYANATSPEYRIESGAADMGFYTDSLILGLTHTTPRLDVYESAIFNANAGDKDFTIKKNISGDSFVYDASADTLTLDSTIITANVSTGNGFIASQSTSQGTIATFEDATSGDTLKVSKISGAMQLKVSSEGLEVNTGVRIVDFNANGAGNDNYTTQFVQTTAADTGGNGSVQLAGGMYIADNLIVMNTVGFQSSLQVGTGVGDYIGLMDSDVANPFVTDAVIWMDTLDDLNGGGRLTGYREASEGNALVLRGISAPAHSDTAAVIELQGYLNTTGTTLASLADDDELLIVRNNTIARMTMLGNGDTTFTGNTITFRNSANNAGTVNFHGGTGGNGSSILNLGANGTAIWKLTTANPNGGDFSWARNGGSTAIYLDEDLRNDDSGLQYVRINSGTLHTNYNYDDINTQYRKNVSGNWLNYDALTDTLDLDADDINVTSSGTLAVIGADIGLANTQAYRIKDSTGSYADMLQLSGTDIIQIGQYTSAQVTTFQLRLGQSVTEWVANTTGTIFNNAYQDRNFSVRRETSGDFIFCDAGTGDMTLGVAATDTLTLTADADLTVLTSQPTGGTDLAVATTKYVDDNVSAAAFKQSQLLDTVQTTNATVTDISAIPVAEGEAYAVTVNVIGKEGDTNRANYCLKGLFYRAAAGNVTQQGVTHSEWTEESDTDWDCDLIADTITQSIDVRVTGKAATTIDWQAHVMYHKVG